MFDLLTEALVPVVSNGKREPDPVTLPELFGRLVSDSVDAFPGLTAHQAQAWYQFLAQLGAIALHRVGRTDLPGASKDWRASLAELTPECADTAWSLVAANASKPALLQPPTKRVDQFKLVAETPDALDVLVTAKNHDRKQAQATAAAPHSWLYALVTLQTSQGYSGRRNPGIARMNGGLASRVLVDRRPSARWGPRIVRSIRMLLNRRSELLERVSDDLFRSDGGLAITWLQNWDTDVQLNLRDLDPYFIEVCRRVRLTTGPEGRIRALGLPANKTRVQARALKGNLGDPWVPINLGKGGQSSLTVSANGFDYRLAQRILFNRRELTKPLSLRELPGERGQDSEIHMTVLVRGQGKTEGLHERVIPLSYSVAVRLFDSDDEDDWDNKLPLAKLSENMVSLAGEARRVLRQAVLVYLQGPENPNFQRRDATPIVAKYDRAIDVRFFDSLFAAPTEGIDETSRRWQQFLREEAVRLANAVWSRTSPPSARREKARAKSEAVLYGGLRKHLPDAFPTQHSKERSS